MNYKEPFLYYDQKQQIIDFNNFQVQMLSPQTQQKILTALLKRPQNHYCADCNGKSPCWVSLDFGVFVCMNCSGAHRALGPSITRVRSTKLDTWNKEWVDNMKIGNSILNQYWEKQLSQMPANSKPNVNSSLNDIKKYVFDKYIKKKFIDSTQQYDPLTRLKKGLKSSKPQNDKVIPSNQSSECIQNIPKTMSKPTSPSKQVYKKHNYHTVKESTLNFSKDDISKKTTQQNQKKNNIDLLMFNQPIGKNDKNLNNKFKQAQKFDFNFDKIQFDKTKKSTQQHSGTEKNQVTFENFLQNISNKSESSVSKPNAINQQLLHENYFMSPRGFVQNSGQNSHQLQHGYSQPSHYPSFLTMNINMNMYPSVMNINMGNNYPANIPLNQGHNFSNNNLSHAPVHTTHKGFEYNDFFTNGIKPPPNINSGINLDLSLKDKGNGENKSQSKEKSWVDDWM